MDLHCSAQLSLLKSASTTKMFLMFRQYKLQNLNPSKPCDSYFAHFGIRRVTRQANKTTTQHHHHHHYVEQGLNAFKSETTSKNVTQVPSSSPTLLVCYSSSLRLVTSTKTQSSVSKTISTTTIVIILLRILWSLSLD